MALDEFLPVTIEDMQRRGWNQCDFILISGDAYVDHPSFGTGIISRILESKGYRVGIIPQPNWRDLNDFKRLGRPKYAFLITAGNLDSMVNHYTAGKKRRSEDAYSPGGKAGLRPDRATIVYSHRAREAYKNVPIILGGVEASLRRFAHYDYWDDKVRRSVVSDAKGDLLIYGMGERQIIEVAKRLDSGESLFDPLIPGVAYISKDISHLQGFIMLPSYEEVAQDKKKFAQAFLLQYQEQDPIRGHLLIQPHMDGYLIQTPPAMPLSQGELDAVYALPYSRTYHPSYEELGGVPAIKEVEFSITSHRGCFGGCSFCALTFHQGRIIQNRSQKSILAEAEKLTWLPNFKGYIHDVGGPSANFRHMACSKQSKVGTCKERQCLFPSPCANLEVDHQEYLELLRKLRKLDRVKKVFVRSGIRYDYLLADPSDKFFRELCEHHISGQLKVAPEHVSRTVLARMGKPGIRIFDEFRQRFQRINQNIGKEQYLVPYFMSGHPGCGLKEAIEMAEYIRDMGYNPEQVQDFIPTPGTLSTCMYYTGMDPRTGEKIYVPKNPKEKGMQRALLQFRNPKNYGLVYQALLKAGKEELIGFGPKCLIRPPLANRKGTKISKEHPSPGVRIPNEKSRKQRTPSKFGQKARRGAKKSGH